MSQRLLLASFSLAVAGAPLRAQTHDHGKPAPAAAADTAADVKTKASVDESMAGHLTANAHMRMSSRRSPNASDSARASKVANDLRAAIAKYADPKAAEADGYRLFAPQMKNQRVFHYTSWSNAFRNNFSFDPARPTSLLYKRDPSGSMKLIGAMYTAPKAASMDDLDKRVPLSVAQWHLHTNWCVPPRGSESRWRETVKGKPKFGPLSDADTRKECDAVGGKFHPVLFNWMVHANVYETDVWGDDHGSGAHQH